MDDLYQDILLDHYKNPKNFGEMEDADVKVRESNASCGDLIEVYVKKKGKTWDEIKFRGVGCAVSVAFTSMLIEYLKEKGLKAEEVLAMDEEELLLIAGLEKISPTRRKCAMLGLAAVKKALKELT